MNSIQKYYVHIDNQQKGPFALQELKELNISRDTMIWYEGLETWIKAIDSEELTEIFKNVPPPLELNKVIPPPLYENLSNPVKEVKS
jgi:hypothetical protein